jgi:two-component system, NtrC family, response regulator AtoC
MSAPAPLLIENPTPRRVWPVPKEELQEDIFLSNENPAMARLYSRVARLAGVDVPVLLLGESGVGKEVVARRIHNSSARARARFVKLNCAALPAELIESELFGYEAGAFTGATKSKPGLFELADGGTLLLDEIGEIPPFLQAKLLHALQDHRFLRLGGRCVVNVNVRILAATNIKIQEALETKKLRQDLYYRLSAFTLQIPPLRERREEIPLLLSHLLARLAPTLDREVKPVPPEILDACMRYEWPGNIRELENFVKRYLIFGDTDEIFSEDVFTRSGGPVVVPKSVQFRCDPNSSDLKQMVRDLKAQAESAAIRLALQRSNGRRAEAARLLNISTKALAQKWRRYSAAQARDHGKAAGGAPPPVGMLIPSQR